MNANLCSAAIWPEMGESAALTTGSEAESISAHFLDHLVPHPKRGKYGLYHSPTLSFLSLHCWLPSCGHRDCPTRAGAPPGACWGAAWEGIPSPPHHLTRPQIFAFKKGERQQRGARHRGSTQAGEEEGNRRSIPGCPERCWERVPAPASSLQSPAPASLPFQGELGALGRPGREAGGWGEEGWGGRRDRLTLWKLRRPGRGCSLRSQITPRGQTAAQGAGPGGA